MAGAFHITVSDDVVTVSAISSPVMLMVDGRKTLVPVGAQLSVAGELPSTEAGYPVWANARVVSPLPEHFLREKLVALERFPHEDHFIPASVRDLRDANGFVEMFEFKAARKRVRDSAREQLLGAIRYRLEQGDEAGARTLLQSQEHAAALADNRSLPILVGLVARFPDISPGLRSLLLRPVGNRGDIWLLGAFHPLLRTSLWVNASPQISPEEQLILAFLLPQSGMVSGGISPVILRWWAEDVTAVIGSEEDPVPLVTELLTWQLPVVRRNLEEGYPESAQILVKALEAFAQPLAERIHPDLLQELRSVRALTEQEIEIFPMEQRKRENGEMTSNTLPSSSSSSLTADDASHLVQVAEENLGAAGALFTVQTSVAAMTENTVRVNGILFPSSEADRIYDFNFNVQNQKISSIVQDGVAMPYGLSLDAFLAWARK
jgi:hypothetical protein